jgi:hypothetical protein
MKFSVVVNVRFQESSESAKQYLMGNDNRFRINTDSSNWREDVLMSNDNLLSHFNGFESCPYLELEGIEGTDDPGLRARVADFIENIYD